MEKSKISALADDLSTLVLNKVLAKDLTIQEGLMSLVSSVVYAVAKSMPEEKFNQEMDKSIPLSTAMAAELNANLEERKQQGRNTSIAELILGINNLLEYAIEQVEE